MRKSRWILLNALTLLGSFAGGAAMVFLVFVGNVGNVGANNRVYEAEAFRLVDEEGNIQAELSLQPGGSKLVLYNASGVEGVELFARGYHSAMSLKNGTDSDGITASTSQNNSRLLLKGPAPDTGVSLSSGLMGSTNVVVKGEDGLTSLMSSGPIMNFQGTVKGDDLIYIGSLFGGDLDAQKTDTSEIGFHIENFIHMMQ